MFNTESEVKWWSETNVKGKLVQDDKGKGKGKVVHVL